jgi:hypothetical protein
MLNVFNLILIEFLKNSRVQLHRSRGEIKKKSDFQRKGLDCKTSELQGAN